MNKTLRSLGVLIDPVTHRALRHLAIEQDSTISDLVRSAIARTFPSLNAPTKSPAPRLENES